MINSVILVGRLSKDIELRYTETNKAVANTTIAINRPRKEDGTQEADFINVVVWGNQAENLNKYCSKGSKVAIDGRIQVRSYDTRDGQKRYATEVVANNVQFLNSKKEEDRNEREKTNREIVKEAMQEDPFEEFGKQISADDLPFDE